MAALESWSSYGAMDDGRRPGLLDVAVAGAPRKSNPYSCSAALLPIVMSSSSGLAPPRLRSMGGARRTAG
jgi:hypothetical protein